MRLKQGENHQKGQEVKTEKELSYIVPTATFNFWDILTSFHPYRNEILCIVRMLNGIGVSFKIIAASLSLKRWRTFFGTAQWDDEDVKNVLKYLSHKDAQINSALMATD